MRAYRATPGAAAALAPALPARTLLERIQDLGAAVQSRLPFGGGGDSAISQVAAAGGTHGAGMAASAKLFAICAGAAGGAGARVAPAPRRGGSHVGALPYPLPSGETRRLGGGAFGSIASAPAGFEPATHGLEDCPGVCGCSVFPR